MFACPTLEDALQRARHLYSGDTTLVRVVELSYDHDVDEPDCSDCTTL